MSKQILWLVALLVSFSIGLSSCAEDTPTADPYENWQARNEHYIDSIATVATTNASGNWERILNYKIQESTGGTNLGGYDVDQYVYMKILEPAVADGIAPLFTDSVSVYYRGELINGEVFDESYSGELNTEVHEPTTFALQATTTNGLTDGLIVGWVTALQQMKEGMRVRLYIPANLGYGSQSKTSIPAYSTLIFDLKLEKVIHPIGPDGRSRALQEE